MGIIMQLSLAPPMRQFKSIRPDMAHWVKAKTLADFDAMQEKPSSINKLMVPAGAVSKNGSSLQKAASSQLEHIEEDDAPKLFKITASANYQAGSVDMSKL